MFERFDDSARLTLLAATEQARWFRHSYIGSEHLLLGLLSRGDQRPARALSSLGVSYDRVRDQLVEILGPPAEQPLSSEGHLPFTPRTKRILQLAEAERERLAAARIDDVQLLLALLREREGVAAQLLGSMGVGIDEVQRALAELS
jgi:ATP-dependent Clp protease ATP-binding subunit ClpC